MEKMIFKAYAITNEIDLNKIAIQCGIPKKYTWEEPLILKGEILSKILGNTIHENGKIMVFSFGSIVFINIPTDVNFRFVEYIKSFKPEIDLRNWDTYFDDYELHIENDNEMVLTDNYALVSDFEIFYPELISTVIAKSVALEKTEEQLGKILDVLENMIVLLERGKLRVSDKNLAKTTARIVKHEYNTIAYIMILDRPDITWENSHAAEFYDKMSIFFELNDRYEILRKKTEILYHIMSGFSSISHSIRGFFLEWIVIILIIFEVILMIAEFFK